MISTSSRIRTSCLINLPRTMLRLVVGAMSEHAYLNRHLNIMRVVNNPYCNYCQGAYETAAHFAGECDRCASTDLRGGGNLWFRLPPQNLPEFNSKKIWKLVYVCWSCHKIKVTRIFETRCVYWEPPKAGTKYFCNKFIKCFQFVLAVAPWLCC